MSDLEITWDKGSPNGDETAVCLRVGDQMHFIPDPFASALLRLLHPYSREALEGLVGEMGKLLVKPPYDSLNCNDQYNEGIEQCQSLLRRFIDGRGL